MTLRWSIDGSEPLRPRPVGRREEQRPAQSAHLASGTLACPACDAPVAPGPLPLAPADAIGCPFCSHVAAARDFLSLATPTRPARVEVCVRHRHAPIRST